ncbi:hypothetical protein [Streptomyces sp. CA2R106]|uniref:hypothetical protein n=1 Tax=Streptomyces sp. CA2R106 TaxID=3120153 RepID=UPI003009D3B5
MSVRGHAERQRFRGIDDSGAHPVEFRFSHARNGNRHLVVVFANFHAPEDFGFAYGVLDGLRANVLWIRDRFDGKCSYYLCRGMDFSIESAVAALISKVMRFLSLTPADCTLIGSSKGGSAALYFGLRYGFRNILASAPQFAIGSYVMTEQPGAAQYMMGRDVSAENVRVLDSVIPEAVRGGIGRSSNIYLFSAPADEQYGEQIEPYLDLFRDYQNFNFFFADSPSITRHNQVAARNLPLIMGIVNLLIDGITPKMGRARHGHEDPDGDRSLIEEYVRATAAEEGGGFGPPTVSAPQPGQRVAGSMLGFSGTARGADLVSFWEGGRQVGSTPVAAEASWSWAPVKPWARGGHAVEVVAVNGEGARSDGTVVEFTVLDTLGPPVLTVPSDGRRVWAAGDVRAAGTAPGAARVEFWERGRRLGWAPVAHDASWTWTPDIAWAAGKHLVKVFAADAHGSASPRTDLALTVTSAPGVVQEVVHPGNPPKWTFDYQTEVLDVMHGNNGS